MANVTIYDNGAAFCICVDGLIVSTHNSLGNAWRRIAWMHRVASQHFTVGESRILVEDWIEAGINNGFLDPDVGFEKEASR